MSQPHMPPRTVARGDEPVDNMTPPVPGICHDTRNKRAKRTFPD